MEAHSVLPTELTLITPVQITVQTTSGREDRILCSKSPSTTSVDAVGPSDTAALLGGAATLTCSNPAYTSPGSGAALWSEGGVPFGTQQNGIYTAPEFAKYTNFGIVSNEYPQMDLTVSNAQVEDEGTYTCTLPSDQGSATLTVEIEGNEPTTTLNSDPSVTPIRLIAGEQSVLRCTASGFRPAVNLEWYKDDIKITAGVSEDPATNNGDTFTTVGTLTFTPTIPDDGDRLECRTIGQEVATAKTGGLTLNVQYAPVVKVDYSGGQITCSSDANPLATTHQIIRNGTDVLKTFPNSPGSVEFTPNYCAVISCNATNTIGTGTDTFAQQICPELSTELPRTTEVPSKAMHPTIKSTVGVIVGAVVAAFIGGVLVSGIMFYIMKRRHQVQHERDGLHQTIKHDGDHLNQDGPHKRTPKREQNQGKFLLTFNYLR
ncbi:cell adhesion molecule 3-like [Patiria miniata]|uniref:Ig-like domain-containing protein n=1 Tax=Patiria miniata TaxID=46514 RepID=A0A914AFK7_PATMI|nr:cell adhesion molecule 3-like [Patiria miniata]